MVVSAFNVKLSEAQIKFSRGRNSKNGYLVYSAKELFPYFPERLFKKY